MHNLAHEFAGLELKSETTDPVEEVKTAIAGLTADINAKTAPVSDITKRLEEIEKKLARPALHLKGDNDNQPSFEAKAFENYLRGTADVDEVKTLTIEAPGTGGVIAPPDFSATVLEKVAEFSPIRTLANVIGIGGPLLQIPVLDDEVDPAERTETGTAATSEPTFSQVDIKPFEMAVTVPVSEVLIEDSKINLASFLTNHIARRFGQKEATWLVKGNGTTQAEGVMVPTLTEVEAGVASVTSDVIIDLFYAIKSAYSANGSWLMNRKTMAAVRKLKDGDGTYLWQPSFQAGTTPLLLGRPVYEAVDMDDIGAGKSPIAFGDFNAGYTIADRIGFSMKIDDITGATQGIRKFIARRRVGGKATMTEALAKLTMPA